MKPRMMKRNSQFQSSLPAVCNVLLMLCAGQAGLAQQSATDKPAAAAPAKPGGEGIKVHGHWIIDVKNRDGSLAQHRDFENSLADGGQFLAGLASGYTSFGGYAIVLVGNACPIPFSGNNTNCYFVQSGASSLECVGGLVTCIGALTVAANLTGTGTPAYSIVLSGSGTVPLAGTISAVQTQYNNCYSGSSPTSPSPASPASCISTGAPGGSGLDGGQGNFTGTTLAVPLAVASGQIIQVTVTISFS
jgi:hypothetical protein